MRRNFIYGTLLLALTGCTSDVFTGDPTLRDYDKAPISFSFELPATTRAEGAEAAAALGNQFIVYGEKNETDGTAPSIDGSTAHQLVFRNYIVQYTTGSDFTSTSNTRGWEYVGISPTYGTNVSPQSGAAGEAQTIKYWDYAATNYVFTAFSADNADLESGRVRITKNQSGATVYDKGYTVTLTKDASNNYPDITKIYFADRKQIDKGTGADRTADNAYGGNATFTFRKATSQVRVGMYETIPGYAISAIKFYVSGNNEAKNAADAPAFGAIVPNISAENVEGTLTVTYRDNSVAVIENRPVLSFTPAAGLLKDDLILGTNLNAISTTNTLGTSAATPTFDSPAGAYTTVLPQPDNNGNLQLKVDYTLYNASTLETIRVTGASAVVPAIYLRWQPNTQYTYLFKISDDTNGQTNPSAGPEGLYPITLDAVEIVDAYGQAEYITTVCEPTITTFGTKTTAGVTTYVHDGREYEAGSDIYATFMEGSVVMPVTIGGGSEMSVNIYKVVSTDENISPITEQSVPAACAAPGTTVGNLTATIINTDATVNFTAAPSVVNEVPGEDGSTITQKAVRLSGVKTGTYVLEYIASSDWHGTDDHVYKVVKVTAP